MSSVRKDETNVRHGDDLAEQKRMMIVIGGVRNHEEKYKQTAREE